MEARGWEKEIKLRGDERIILAQSRLSSEDYVIICRNRQWHWMISRDGSEGKATPCNCGG